ncbi:SRPBCC family protein [Hoeflea sp. G2-23]|uniref:SRPBCC family protein n=1 Tax=Hoeflea algicola TaxID=2983763 RepID=A0ABT3Z7R7_9HYPH|nr:SRPBCC family protein [Hoeflea algicola]MCY0147805.1 SRPBCC family protein [Hoeflea algicola]
MAKQKITIVTEIAAPLERVWAGYTAPEAITQWNFASTDWCCPRAETDLKVGGKYCARMEAKDGSFGFDFEGVYEEVELHKAITLVMNDGRKARTTFEINGNMTKVNTAFDAEDQNSIEMQRDGWQAILDNFKHYVEAQ